MHAPEKDIAKYKGMYDAGYSPIRKARYQNAIKEGVIDKKWRMTADHANWEKFPHKEWDIRCMEVYAAMVDRVDQNIGRLVTHLKEKKVWESPAGKQLTIPLKLTRRGEFSPDTIKLKTFGGGFERVPAFDVKLYEKEGKAVVDLAKLKTPPGDYVIAFYGSAVSKYSSKPKSKPKDIVDIIVTEPIPIRVTGN